MKIYVQLCYLSEFFLEVDICQINLVEQLNHPLYVLQTFSENLPFMS